MGEPRIKRRYGRSWFLLPNGSAQARIQSLCGPVLPRSAVAGGPGLLMFQESEGAADGLAAGGRA